MAHPTYERIYAVVRRIPAGRVATYGQVAALAALPGQARLVGYALHALPATTAVPWHRVINAEGRISMRRAEPGGALTQQLLLEREGVVLDGLRRVVLGKYGWRSRDKGQGTRDKPRDKGAPGSSAPVPPGPRDRVRRPALSPVPPLVPGPMSLVPKKAPRARPN